MQMCTTACMQVAMAILCRQINICREHASISCHSALLQTLNGCMHVGCVVHGRVERILNARTRGEAGVGANRMVSVNELLSTLCIDLGSLGVITEELVVCMQGRGTILKRRVACNNAQHLVYEPTSCFICLDQLPACMLVSLPNAAAASTDAARGGPVCVALATAN